MRKLFKVGAVLSLALAVGCVSRSEIEEIKKGQKEILAKLDTISRGGGRGQQGPQGPQPGQPDPTKTYAVPLGQSHIKGSPDAWVTIVEFSEFQCPFCKRVGPTLKEVSDKFGNDVRIVFKHNPLPFHPRAKPAAKASECAGEQGKFYEMHDKLFEGQPKLEDADFETYAKDIGLNTGKWSECYKSTKFEDRIDADQKLSAQFGARGTPAFFINGRFLSGAQPFPSFEAVINEELKKAKDSGISKKDYYAKAVVEKGVQKL